MAHPHPGRWAATSGKGRTRCMSMNADIHSPRPRLGVLELVHSCLMWKSSNRKHYLRDTPSVELRFSQDWTAIWGSPFVPLTVISPKSWSKGSLCQRLLLYLYSSQAFPRVSLLCLIQLASVSWRTWTDKICCDATRGKNHFYDISAKKYMIWISSWGNTRHIQLRYLVKTNGLYSPKLSRYDLKKTENCSRLKEMK